MYYALHTCVDDDYKNNNIHDEGTKNRQKRKKMNRTHNNSGEDEKRNKNDTHSTEGSSYTKTSCIYIDIYIMRIIYTRVYADRAVLFWNIMDYPTESTMACIQ